MSKREASDNPVIFILRNCSFLPLVLFHQKWLSNLGKDEKALSMTTTKLQANLSLPSSKQKGYETTIISMG